jgi:integrase/recombinase XerD
VNAGRAGAPARPAPGTTAFDGLLDAWLFHLSFERRLASLSVAAYGSDLRSHLKFLREHGLQRPEEVTPDLLREALAEQHDRGRAPRSRQRSRASIRSFYRWLTHERILEADPARELESPRAPRELPRVLTRDETARLLEACGGALPLDQRDCALIEVAYGTGLRASELVGLSGEQCDLREHWVRVPGKGNKERMVPLGRPAVQALRTYFAKSRPLLLGRHPDPGTVFLNARGGPLSRMGFWKILRRRARLAGLDFSIIHPHLLRHSFATHLLQGGASLRVVQELLGHTDLTTTEIYTAVDREFMRRIHQEFHPRG